MFFGGNEGRDEMTKCGRVKRNFPMTSLDPSSALLLLRSTSSSVNGAAQGKLSPTNKEERVQAGFGPGWICGTSPKSHS